MDATSTGMIGKYQVIRVLGRGGMGEVVLAQDDLGRRVAIKRPFKSALEDGLARFKLEARASTLSHPNIPAVYEMGMQDGLPFIAMEFVEGDPLDKLIASGKPLDLIAKLSIIEQVCSGLGHAHQKGIIHRDIKPANVIVQPNGVAKIIDFGIAKIQNLEQTSGLTQTSQIIGSLHYIAPERFKGEAIDGRVDVFSAGVMLYLLLTGHLPFGGGEATASYRIVNEAHNSLGSHIRDYPPALDGIMDQALAKDPEDRFRTADDFADALHEVIEELKKTRVFQLVDDAERLNMESRFAPALELLEEALKIDPANTQARKLRKFVREHQDRQKRSERLRELVTRADEALAAENYADALALLKDAQRMDATFPQLAEKIQYVEDRKRRYELAAAALAEAAAARDRGDITAALRITDRAVQQDPENSKLLAVRAALAKQAESEALQGKVLAILDSARREIAAQHFPAAEQLLGQAEAIDPSHPKIDELRREVSRLKELEERRQLLDEIHKRVNEFLRSDNYPQAVDLLNRAIDKLPTETSLHRLKVEVDTAARKFGSKRFVDGAITAARELFSSAPLEALAGLQKAIEQMPGEERLVAYERTLRQEFDARRVQQQLGDTLRKARDLISERQFDKAIGVLESYHLEFGNQADVDDLLIFARNELAGMQRRTLLERTTVEVRSLIRDERLDDAVRLLDSVLSQSADATLSQLLEDVREQQAALMRKLEVVHKRVALLRERGELDEAIQVLQEYLAATPRSPRIQELLTTLLGERELKQITNQAIATARQAAQRHEFAAALESLQTVLRAYGESAELTRETEQVQAQRASFATEVVAKSIEAARAALLKNDAEGALTALKGSIEMVEFADAAKQADWQRIGQSAKKALQQAGTTTAVGADFLGAIGEAPAKSRTPLILGIAGACVVLIAVVTFILLRPTHPSGPQPQPPQTRLKVTHVPLGAVVSVDNKATQTAGAGGELTFDVTPGDREIEVSQKGYDPASFRDSVDQGSNTFSLPSLILSGTSAKLTLLGNLDQFKVSVDGQDLGQRHKGEKISLKQGNRTVKFSNLDGSDSVEQKYTVVAGVDQNTEPFNLKAPKPTAVVLGKLTVATTPGAQISIDGQPRGVADSNGSFTSDGLSRIQHTVDISLGTYDTVHRLVDMSQGQNQTLPDARLTKTPVIQPTGGLLASADSIERGKQVTLKWQVSNASSAEITGLGKVELQGTKADSPKSKTTYQLIADGKPLQSVTVDVTDPPPPPHNSGPDSAQSKPAGPPDLATLMPAVNAYRSVVARVAHQSKKECLSTVKDSFQGALMRSLSPWCDEAKSVEAQESCSNPPAGTEDAPTLTCGEVLTIVTKDGNPTPPQSVRKTFHFTKKDGSWQVVKLD